MNRLSGSSLVLWGACALLFAAGCGGCFKSPDERRLVGLFVQPVAGGQVTDADRAEGDTLPGLRVTVEAAAEWESLTSGKREPALPGPSTLRIRELGADGDGGTFVEGPTAQVTDAGTVVFPGVEFPASGTYELELAARAGDSDFVSEPVVIAVTAVTSNGRPSVESVALPQDLNGDGLLNAEEVPPGTPVELVVTASGMDAGTVKLTALEPPVEASSEYFVTGTPVSLDFGADPLERTVDVTVLLTNPLGQQNSVGQLPGVPLDALALQALKLDQVAPTLAFTAPDAGVLLTDNAVTLQVAVTGADDQPVAFTRAPRDTPEQETDVGSAVVTGGAASADVALPNGQWLLRARVLDASGNAAIPAELQVDVANGRPSVQLVTLTQDLNADGVLNAAELAVGALLQLDVQASGMEDGGTLKVSSAATATEVTVQVSDGGAQAGLDLDAGVAVEAELPLQLLLTNTAGVSNNVGQLAGVTLDPLATPTVRVDQVPPTVSFLAPDAGVVLLDNAVQLQAAVTGAETQVVTFTRALRSDSTVETDVGTAPVAAGVAQLDAVLPNGQWLLRARVLDAAGNAALPAEVAMDVANGRPQVDAVVLAQDLNADGILNAAELAVGAPLQLDVAASGMADGGTLKVSSAATGTEVTVQVTDGGAQAALDLDAGVAVEADVPLQLLLTTVDGISNNVGQLQGVALDLLATPTVRVDQVPPGMTLTAPAAGSTVSSNEVTLTVTVTGADGQPVTFMRVDGSGFVTVMGTVPVSGGAASVAGAVTNGTWTFRAEVADVAGNPTVVEAGGVVVAGQQLAITSPANGRVFKASDDQSPAGPGFQGTVVFQPAANGGFTVDLCLEVDPGTGPATPCPDGSAFFLVRAGATSPATGITIPEGGPTRLRAVRSYAGGVFDVSADVTVSVNSSRPAVTALALPQDLNLDGTLNLAELGAGPAQVQVTATDAESLLGAAVTLFNDTTGAACGTGTLDGLGVATVAVEAACTPLPGEFSLPLRVRVTDAAGNANRLLPGDVGTEPINTAAFVTLQADTVAPSFAFSSPSPSALLGLAADSNLANSTFDLFLEGAAPGAASVDFLVTGGAVPEALTGAPSTNGFSAVAALASSGTVQYTVTATPVDAAGNLGTTESLTVDVDLDAPAVSISAPASGLNTANRQVTVTLSVPGETGTAEVYSVVGVVETLRGTVAITSGNGSDAVSLSNGTQDVRVNFTDAAGNVGTAVVANITISDASCDLLVTVPAATATAVGRALDAQPASPSTVEIAYAGTSSNCAGRTVTVRQRGGAALCTAVVNGSGAWACDPATVQGLPEGTAALDAEVTNTATPAVTTTVQLDFTVDLQAPGLSTTDFEEGATLLFVNASNVHLLDGGAPDAGGALYLQDGNASADGAQVTFSVTVTGAQGGTVQVLLADAGVGTPEAVTQDPAPVSLVVTLPHDQSGVLSLEVLDAAGNSTRRNAQAVIDVVPPSTPTMTATVLDDRAAAVDLSWSVTGDDGSSGAAAGYDVRWSTNALNIRNVPALASTQAVDIHSGNPNRNFYSSAVMARAGAGLASGTSLQVSVPPMASSVGFVVRAQDEVGNVSAITSTATVSTEWTRQLVGNPGTGVGTNYNSSFGSVVSEVADLNGDGISDFVTSSPGGFGSVAGSVSGQVHVLYGGAAGLRRQTFTAPAAGTTQFFGADVSMGNVAGPAGGGVRPDLVVGASTFSSNAGRAYLYVGTEAGGDLSSSSPIEFAAEGAGGRFGTSTRVIADLDGDGFRELVISAPTFNAGAGTQQGRVYLYRGRTEAQWLALVSGGAVPASAADCVINGPTPPVASGLGSYFGHRQGFLSLPDLNGGGTPELAIPAPSDPAGRVFIFSGEALVTCMQADATVEASSALQVLSASSNLSSNNSNSGFGQYCAGGVDVLGDSNVELLVSHPTRSAGVAGPDGVSSPQGRVEIFSASGGATPWTTPEAQYIRYTGNSVARFGNGLGLGNFQQGPASRLDLVVGHFRVPGASEGGVWFFNRNTTGSGSTYDTDASAGFRQGFRVAESGSSLGTNIVVGDFTGDGLLDIVSTDSEQADFNVDVTGDGVADTWRGGRLMLWH